MNRILAWEGCFNVRDLGGVPLAGGGATRHRAIVRAGSLASLTADGWAAATAYGVTTIVDLSCPTEPAYAPPPGMRRVAEPIFYHRDQDFAARARQSRTWLDFYDILIRYRRDALGAAVSAVADAHPTTLVHCQSGRDRTGIVSALLLAIAGAPDDAIAEDYAESRRGLAVHYDQLREAAVTPEDRERVERLVATPPDAMIELLSRIRRFAGSTESYLISAGVSPGHFALIRKRLAA